MAILTTSGHGVRGAQFPSGAPSLCGG